MAPRAAPALRVLPLALAAAIFSGLTAILIYLSGISSSRNAPPPLSRPSVCVSCGRSLTPDWWVRADGGARLSEADLAALAALRGSFSKCVVRSCSSNSSQDQLITIRFVLVLLLISCRIVVVTSGVTNSWEPPAVVDWEGDCFKILDSVCQLF